MIKSDRSNYLAFSGKATNTFFFTGGIAIQSSNEMLQLKIYLTHRLLKHV